MTLSGPAPGRQPALYRRGSAGKLMYGRWSAQCEGPGSPHQRRRAWIVKQHYTLSNFSKFVRPDYVRVNVSGSAPANVLLWAGANSVVVVAISTGTSTASVPISIAGGTVGLCTPWLTSANADLISQTAVPVNGGSFTTSLVGPSVTTFVCK